MVTDYLKGYRQALRERGGLAVQVDASPDWVLGFQDGARWGIHLSKDGARRLAKLIDRGELEDEPCYW